MMNELNVITVPALDWDGRWHTAFTVYSEADGVLQTSSGWVDVEGSLFCLVVPVSKDSTSYWNIAGGFIAILFNPLVPIYLNNKDLWQIIDVVVFIYLIVMANKAKDWAKKKKDENSDSV